MIGAQHIDTARRPAEALMRLSRTLRVGEVDDAVVLEDVDLLNAWDGVH